MKPRHVITAVFLGIVALIVLGTTHRTEISRDSSPSGGYTAVYSHKTYLSFLPMPPGSSSDKPCFVKILDSKGKNCGEIPVPMIQMAGVEWESPGAVVRNVGEWDFAKGTCFYWSEDQYSQIFVKR